jgi:hypothetical protein
MVCAGPLLAIAGAIAVADLQRRSKWLGAAGALLLLAPSIWICWPLLREPEPPLGIEAQAFLRAAAVLKTQGGPRSRVLAPWSWGHVFEFPGEQIPVVDGFGSSIGSTDFENALGVVLSSREESVAAYCRDHGIRYVVLQNPLTHLTVQAASIGLPASFFVRGAENGTPARILPMMRFSFWWRAYFDQGRSVHESRRSAEAFRHFRVVYADAQPSDGPPRFRGPALEVWELAGP